ncbi:GAF and ANTAR domain-containing protein [Streptomyces sp. NPDC087300]|uniref:GAF and ANTAR domain-containing protein n=1 Tax=Streptomyces sp. NPDC087300 TaxID=3365780 RepID=UPI00382290EA
MRDGESELRLADVLVESADTLTDGFDPEAYLRWLADRCVELLGAQGAGVMYTGEGEAVQLIPGTREQHVVHDLLAVQRLGGPCLESLGTGEPVPPVPIDARGAGARWPAFAERADLHGIAGTYAVPLRSGGPTLGVLNVFVPHAPRVDGSRHELRVAQTLARAAAVGLRNHRTHAECRTLSDQLQTALDSRVRIEQAKGILAERWGTGMDEAFDVLRRFARRERLVIDAVATQVIKGEINSGAFAQDSSEPS